MPPTTAAAGIKSATERGEIELIFLSAKKLKHNKLGTYGRPLKLHYEK